MEKRLDIGGNVGESFKNKRGSYYTLINKDKGLWVVSCSSCSSDKELFPEGSIRMSLSDIRRGRTACGCSYTPRWEDWQYVIRVKRVIEPYGLEFIGFEGEFKSQFTKVIILNPATKETKATQLKGLLKGRVPFQWYKRRSTLEEHVESFYSNPEIRKRYYAFERSGEKFKYRCRVCDLDMYSLSGVGSKTFEAAGICLRRGFLSCRCSDKYPPSKAESEHFLKETLDSSGGEFLGWIDGNKILKRCNQHHITNMIFKGINFDHTKCRICRCQESNRNGFLPERVDEEDFLYVMQFRDYIKVGRSFVPYSRREELKRLSGDKSVKTLELFTSNHKQVYESEQAIHEELRILGLYYDSGWTLESFTTEALPKVLELIETKYTQLKPVKV